MRWAPIHVYFSPSAWAVFIKSPNQEKYSNRGWNSWIPLCEFIGFTFPTWFEFERYINIAFGRHSNLISQSIIFVSMRAFLPIIVIGRLRRAKKENGYYGIYYTCSLSLSLSLSAFFVPFPTSEQSNNGKNCHKNTIVGLELKENGRKKKELDHYQWQ